MLGRMRQVSVRIVHAEPSGVGPLEDLLVEARRRNAERQAAGFAEAGATDTRIVTVHAGQGSFGELLRELVTETGNRGLVVLGSGSIPLAHPADWRDLVRVAAADGPAAVTNNRYSSDVLAVSSAALLEGVPAVASDNSLPRWLEEMRSIAVRDLRTRWRLAVDLDSPFDLALLGERSDWLATARRRLEALVQVGRDPRQELVIAGRTSASILRWLERKVEARIRALVEERGMRTRIAGQRPARSVLGMVLDRDGPACLGPRLAELGGAAAVDTRVLLAHRFGADDRGWPSAEDRFASDLLLPDRIADPWLAALTASAASASIPIVLGGHTLVGPGMRLLFGARR